MFFVFFYCPLLYFVFWNRAMLEIQKEYVGQFRLSQFIAACDD